MPMFMHLFLKEKNLHVTTEFFLFHSWEGFSLHRCYHLRASMQSPTPLLDRGRWTFLRCHQMLNKLESLWLHIFYFLKPKSNHNKYKIRNLKMHWQRIYKMLSVGQAVLLKNIRKLAELYAINRQVRAECFWKIFLSFYFLVFSLTESENTAE